MNDKAGAVTDPLRALRKTRLVPVIVLQDATKARPLAAALANGGLPIAEITFRTDAAAEAIRSIAEDDRVLVGAGTVVSPDQVDLAVSAGARFVVSPGFSTAVVERCAHHGVLALPGVATATETQRAVEAGITTVKFFPAESSGGAAAIKALSAPFPQVRFVPTGGIDPTNLKTYLALDSVVAVGGSWMVPPEAVAEGRFEWITRLVAETVEATVHSGAAENELA